MAPSKILLNFKIIYSFCRIISRGDFLLGRELQMFEERLSRFMGCRYACGVASGTDALIIILKACGIGPGDEVIVPAISSTPTASAVSWIGARPIFVDVDGENMGIDPNGMEAVATPKTKAVIVAHLNGKMADMDSIMRVAKQKKLIVIEDAAQAIGARYKDHPPGYYGVAAALSFDIQKMLSTYGDGGAIITNSRILFQRVSLMRFYGARSLKDIIRRHPVVGIASRLQSFQAAVLLEKLKLLPRRIKKWHMNYLYYERELIKNPRVRVPAVSPGMFTDGYRPVIFTNERNSLYRYLRENKVKARIQYHVPLPYLEAFAPLGYGIGDFPKAEFISRNVLFLPNGDSLARYEIDRTARLINTYFKMVN